MTIWTMELGELLKAMSTQKIMKSCRQLIGKYKPNMKARRSPWYLQRLSHPAAEAEVQNEIQCRSPETVKYPTKADLPHLSCRLLG